MSREKTAMGEFDYLRDRKPWQWSEAEWRNTVGFVGSGKSLRPDWWPNGARCCVTISFDADHETIPLHDVPFGPTRVTLYEYGSRVAMGRVRSLLKLEAIRATFFYPAVSALLHTAELRAVQDDGHEIGL